MTSPQTNEKLPFDLWFAELQRIAIEHYGYTPEAAASMCPEAYRNSYYDGHFYMTPEEALDDESSYD